MDKISKKYTFILTCLFIALCFFEAYSMFFMIYASFSSILAILRVIIVFLAIYVCIKTPVIYKNTLLKCFLIWTGYCWMFCLLGMGGSEKSAVFRIVIFEASYFVAFYCSKKSHNTEFVTELGYSVLLLISCYYLIQNNLYIMNSAGREYSITNLVFWSLCSVPGILLIRNNFWRNCLLILAVIACIYGMKRSALIAIAIIMVVYQYHEILSKNASKSAIICLLLAVIVGLYLLRNYFVDLINMNLDRLYSVSEDQGSGRTKVWSDAIDALSNSSVLEFFFGSGVDSTLIRAHHTSAHNDFLTLFLEFGVFGIALYISFWIHLIKQFITLKRSKSIYYMSWFASMTILIVVGGVGDLFTSYVYLPLITVVLGIVDAKVLNEKYATNRRV